MKSETIDSKVIPMADQPASAAATSLIQGKQVTSSNRYISRAEIAVRLKISLRTVDRWLAQDLLPHYRVGNTVLFDWDEVRDYLRRHFRFSPRCAEQAELLQHIPE